MNGFLNKVAMVTGGSAGIGQATVLAFAQAGAAVIIADILEDEGRKLARHIESEGGRAMFVRTDVASEAELADCVRQAVERFGRLDYGINNAGVEQSGRPVVESDGEQFRRIMDVNVGGVLMGMKAQIPAIRAAGGGAIVNLSSIAGLIGFPGAPVYAASKHAVLGLTKTAALECAHDNIRVNAVCPGAIETEMIERFVQHDAAARKGLVAEHPLGRMGRPEEVASAILWLCSRAAGFVTGQHITIDGGYTAR